MDQGFHLDSSLYSKLVRALVYFVEETQLRNMRVREEMRRLAYVIAALLVQVGIFSTRWNVVVGGQLFSKSLRGLTVFKMQLPGIEGLGTGIAMLVLPFVILFVLVKILPPWEEARGDTAATH